MRNPANAARKRLGLSLVVAFAMASIMPAASQDRMVLGPRQFEKDTSGAGAVLCLWSVYLSVQAQTAACALPRRPADDAMDQAINAMDDFIIANSSLHPTKAMLETFKRDVAASEAKDVGPQFCKRQDLERFRSVNPERILANVKALLAVPREPVMNPCL
jgi:hypothetical protein